MTARTNNNSMSNGRMLAACIFVAGRLIADLGEEALPVFLVAAVGLFQVFEDAFKVGVAAEVAPGWVFAEPGVVFVAEIDGATEAVKGLGLVAFYRKICCQAVGHLAVGFSG